MVIASIGTCFRSIFRTGGMIRTNERKRCRDVIVRLRTLWSVTPIGMAAIHRHWSLRLYWPWTRYFWREWPVAIRRIRFSWETK
jgi:hypothetical protein